MTSRAYKYYIPKFLIAVLLLVAFGSYGFITYYPRIQEPERNLIIDDIRPSTILWTYVYLPSTGEIWEVREASIEFQGIMLKFNTEHPNGDIIEIWVPQAQARVIRQPER